MSTRIPLAEVGFHPLSHGDPAGRLFRWNGELYRGLRAPWAAFFVRLVQTGVIQRLVDRGLLIHTELTPFQLDGFEVVLRHHCVQFPSYPEEWCGPMLKDAGLHILTLLEALGPHGLSLKDGHPWNVLFEQGKFVYVDLTSLVSSDGSSGWSASQSFGRFCLNPLRLMSYGHDRIARRLLTEYDGVRDSDLRLFRRPSQLQSIYKTLLMRRQSNHPVTVERLRRDLENVALPHEGQDAPQSEGGWVSSQASRLVQEQTIYRIISELRPGSVLEMNAAGTGCAGAAAVLGSEVVAFGADPGRVTRMYRQVRGNQAHVLPLVMDFIDPTPARGLGAHWAIAATDRFRCDLVLALRLVDQAVFRWRLTFAHVVDGLASFTKRWLLLEFGPPLSVAGENPGTMDLSWYTLENLISSLELRFRTVSIVPGLEDSPAVLVLCEK